MQKHHTLYLAYGSNLNVSQMSSRCPDAIPMGGFYLPDYKLVFRGVADIEYEKGNAVPVGMWHLTDRCIESLDHYEGVDNGLYDRIYIGMEYYSEDKPFMTYQMNYDSIRSPSSFYYHTIDEGYRDFGLSLSFLEKARDYATNNETVMQNYVPDKLGDRKGKWWYPKTS